MGYDHGAHPEGPTPGGSNVRLCDTMAPAWRIGIRRLTPNERAPCVPVKHHPPWYSAQGLFRKRKRCHAHFSHSSRHLTHRLPVAFFR